MARAWLSANDLQICNRTWRVLMDEMEGSKTGPMLIRQRRPMLDKVFDVIRRLRTAYVSCTSYSAPIGTNCITLCFQ